MFDTYDMTTITIFALLAQTGYVAVTAVEEKPRFLEYTLNFPNLEVEEAFFTYLFGEFEVTNSLS